MTDRRPPEDRTQLAGLVLHWLYAVADTSYVSLEPAEKAKLFARWTGLLVDAAATGDVVTARQVGMEMVAADYSEAETLSSSVAVLDERLREEFGVPDHAGLRTAVAGLVAGYTRAVRDRTLDEQEEVRVAALRASAEATFELREAERKARYAALHDALTGLPNRVNFATELDHYLATAPSGARVAVCVLGLDQFHTVNDSLGHAVGDQLLIAVGERLRSLAAARGYVVARLEGDEFALLLTDTTCPDDAAKVADRALDALRPAIFIDGIELPAPASAGVVERPVAGTDAADLLRAADITLHWAKADGRDRWCMFDDERNSRDIARYQLSAALPAALRRDEFFLVYQPLVRLVDRQFVGVEALLRWRHPTLDVLRPDRFIGLAEDTGLMVPLGLWVLERACEEGVGWHAVGPHPPLISVNLSVRQVRAPNFAASVLEILDRTCLPPDKLQLEITERTAIATDDESLAGLRALADHGVRLALDDFGTGHANLAYLRHLPVTELKLAGEFASGVAAGDDADEAIVQGLIDLAHRLGLTVTAEGVADGRAATWLRTVGCDWAQGRLFGMPISPEGITQRLRDGRGVPGSPAAG